MRYRSLFLLLFGLMACTEQFELDVLRDPGQLIVYGHIDNGDGNFTVQLQQISVKAFEFLPVRGARVTLLDDAGNEGRFGTADESGTYTFNKSTLEIKGGRSYHLNIRTPNGQVYESTPECLPEVVAQPEIRLDYRKVNINTGEASSVVTKNVMDVYATTELSETNETQYIRWAVTQTYLIEQTDFPDPFNSVPPPCFVVRTIDIQRLPMYATNYLQGTVIPERLVARQQIDYAFLSKNIITVQTYAHTREAYEYYRKVSILINNKGSIFDTPSAAIKGNIYNVEDPDEEVLGYFDASSTAFTRIQTTRDDFQFPIPDSGCTYQSDMPSASDYPTLCTDCESLPGGTFQRPSYF